MIRLGTAAALAACLMLGASAFAGTKNDPYAMPPNVQAIMKKIQSGHAPTAAEQKAITDWSNGLTGGNAAPAGSTAPQQEQIVSDDDDTRTDAQISADMCRKDGHASGLGQPVSQDAYLAMAQSVKQKYGANLDSDTVSLIVDTLGKQHWSTIGGQFAAALMARNSWSAAIVSAATGAERAPDDAMTANNLGSALRGMKDYGNAAIALNYARTRAPDSAIVASNLGSLAVSYHDAGTARKFYFAALSKAKNMTVPNAELGLQSLCGGKFGPALKYFRASLSGGYTTLAADGLYSAERYMQAQNPGADIGQPSDDSPGASGDKAPLNPVLPTPPIASGVREVVGWSGAHNPDKQWAERYLKEMESQNRMADALIPSLHAGPHTTVKGNTIVFERGYDKENFLLNDIDRIFDRRFDRVRTTANNNESNLTHTVLAINQGPDNCAATRALATKAYPPYVIQAKADWPAIAAVWHDKFQAISPILGQIHNDAQRDFLTHKHVALAYGEENGFAAAQQNVQGAVYLAMQIEDPKCGKLAAFDNIVDGNPPPLKELKKYPDKCKINESMNMSLAAFKGDCDTATLEFNAVVFSGSVNVKWGNDEREDTFTIFGGFGATENIPGTPVAGGGKIGDYITVRNGELIDTGIMASKSEGLSAGPASAMHEEAIKYSTVGNNDWGKMQNGVLVGGTVFTQSNTFQIAPPGIPGLGAAENL